MSPDLFSFFVVDQPTSAELHEVYADESHDAEADVNIDAAAGRLSAAVTEFDQWAKSKDLELAPEKSTVTLLTPDTHQSNYHPPVTVNGTNLKLDID